MMKRRLFICFLIFLINNLNAQDKAGRDYYFGDNFHFHGYSTDVRMMLDQSLTFTVSDRAIFRIFDNFDNDKDSNNIIKNSFPKSPIILGIKLTPKLKNFFTAEVPNFSKTYYSYLISDSSEVTIVAMGIDKNNIHNYRYRLVLNDSIEILKWSPIEGVEMKYGAKKPYGKIGTFKFPGEKLLAEVSHKDSIGIRDGYIIDWTKSLKPEIQQIIVRGASTYGYYGLNLDSLRSINRAKSPPVNSDVLNWTFEKDSVDEFELNFSQHETRPYSIYLVRDINNRKDTLRLEWWLIGEEFTLRNDYLKDTGQYSIFIQQTGQFGTFPANEITQIDFRIVESKSVADSKGYTIKQILPVILSLLLLIGLAFFCYRWNIRRKLKKTERDKQVLNIQMQGIRSQLNPHFMFNSINSIQNLIQKGDIGSAKKYLMTFSSLTREVLEESEKDMHSLSAELKLNEEYLIMEQLRFGFDFKINNQLHIHPDNIEIPVMLLQPFVENAVKHGVSERLGHGEIIINVLNNGDDLIIEIRDNGIGINIVTNSPAVGYGIKLSKKRMTLLNQLYPQNYIEMKFIDKEQGTNVQITLKNWFN